MLLDLEWLVIQTYARTSKSLQREGEIFCLDGLFRELSLDLALNNYRPGQYRCFVVRDPKIREIFAPTFRDRLVHHLIVERLMPFLDRRLIFDSFANRPQKGVQKAVRRLQSIMRRLPPTAYFMKLDIASYFTSINRSKLKKIICWHLHQITEICPAEKLFLIDTISRILDQDPAQDPFFSGDKKLLCLVPPHKSLFENPPSIGMPIGALTSQFFSNIYLNELDHFVKHRLKAPFYIRYVDDFILLDPDSSRLYQWKQEIEKFLKSNLDLSLHPHKTLIQPIHRGCDFLGSVVRPHVITIRPRIISALRSRLIFFNHLLDPKGFPHGKPPAQSTWERHLRLGTLRSPLRPTVGLLQRFVQTINSYYGVMIHGNTYQLRRQIYLHDFHHLKKYMIPEDSFKKIRLRPIGLMEKEGIIAL